MQGELLERFADTQSALIAALDAGDTAAMIAHTRDLGGITDARDVLEFMLAGATAVQSWVLARTVSDDAAP